MATLRPLLLFGLLPLASTALTAQEVAECNAQVDLFDFEMNGGVFVELLLFPYVIVVMHVLIEEWYVPALELVTSPDFLDVPRPLIGCTIMAAGNCLPELSMSLAAVLLSDSQDIGTGEVFGSCVFDLLAILGVLGILAPEGDGIRLAPPLVLYFCAWAAIGTAADASLFFADLETMWSASLVMLALYLCFIGGAFVCWRLIPGFVGEDEVASRLSPAPKVLTLTAEATCAPGARGLVTPTAITAVRSAQRLDQRIDVTGRAEALHPTLIATRAICLLGVRKNALGASVLTLAAGCPDLITAMVIARRPGMLTMAAANPFGAFAFNAFAALGLPWAILGTYADIFPPARGTWYPSLIGFCAIALALLAIFANQLRLTRALGVYLLILYALYLAIIINDSAMRPARPPA